MHGCSLCSDLDFNEFGLERLADAVKRRRSATVSTGDGWFFSQDHPQGQVRDMLPGIGSQLDPNLFDLTALVVRQLKFGQQIHAGDIRQFVPIRKPCLDSQACLHKQPW